MTAILAAGRPSASPEFGRALLGSALVNSYAPSAVTKDQAVESVALLERSGDRSNAGRARLILGFIELMLGGDPTFARREIDIAERGLEESRRSLGSSLRLAVSLSPALAHRVGGPRHPGRARGARPLPGARGSVGDSLDHFVAGYRPRSLFGQPDRSSSPVSSATQSPTRRSSRLPATPTSGATILKPPRGLRCQCQTTRAPEPSAAKSRSPRTCIPTERIAKARCSGCWYSTISMSTYLTRPNDFTCCTYRVPGQLGRT
jgi:hypothetical protein